VILTPKNWDTFQHYKDRAPAWIKLHRGLLDDYTFACLPVASRALAPLLWLLASEYEKGRINASAKEIAFRLRVSERELITALKPLIEKGFFADASNTLAERKHAAIPEKEREIEEQVEKETDIRSVAPATRPPTNDFFQKFWIEYPKRGDASNPKKPAKDKFDRAVRSGADPEIIIASAKRYREIEQSAGRAGTEKVAQAQTWLNQQRWNDYPAPTTPSGAPAPPDPAMPSDAELRARYAANPSAETSGVFPEGIGPHPTDEGTVRH
jgi:hypothetical protein